MTPTPVSSIDSVICEEVTSLASCTIEELTQRLRVYSWLEVFEAVDRLSREGTLKVTRTGRFGYTLSVGTDVLDISGERKKEMRDKGKRSSGRSPRPPVTEPTLTTILLIDGDDNDRTYYADRLKISLPNSIVLEAKDIRSALELYRSRQVDCLVTETRLPDGSGFQLLSDIVPCASEPSVAVVMLSRFSIPGLAQLAMTHGAQACFIKRLMTDHELAEAIQKAIARIGATQKDPRRKRDS